MEKIAFQTNVPVEVVLKTLEGIQKDSQFGGVQHMFQTIDGRAFFVSEAVGNILTAQLKKQGVRPGEAVDIVKAEVATGNGRKSIQWQAHKVGEVPVGEQRDGTFAVPMVQPGASVTAPAPVRATANDNAGKAITSSHDNGNGNKANGNGANATPYAPRIDTALADALKTAVAAAHAAQEFAKVIGYAAMPQFTSEDLRTMANTILIGTTRGGQR